MFSFQISRATLITWGAAALAIFTIVAVIAAALRLIRLATARNAVPDFAQRIQGPQEAPEAARAPTVLE